jgi:hypothetical protein
MLRLLYLSIDWAPYIAGLLVIALLIAGCSSMTPPSTGGSSTQTFGLGGNGTWTWSRTPQGGSDEKSSNTPVQPSQ